MKITNKDVDHVATLARLELDDAERDRMAGQLSDILTYIEKLNELDTDNVQPMAQVMVPQAAGQSEAHPEASLRDDARRAGLPHEQAVAPAPDADDTYVKVPKVIER